MGLLFVSHGKEADVLFTVRLKIGRKADAILMTVTS